MFAPYLGDADRVRFANRSIPTGEGFPSAFLPSPPQKKKPQKIKRRAEISRSAERDKGSFIPSPPTARAAFPKRRAKTLIGALKF